LQTGRLAAGGSRRPERLLAEAAREFAAMATATLSRRCWRRSVRAYPGSTARLAMAEADADFSDLLQKPRLTTAK
jgi:hypothetical protein